MALPPFKFALKGKNTPPAEEDPKKAAIRRRAAKNQPSDTDMVDERKTAGY